MSASWTFVLADSSGNALAELSTASGRTVAYKRNSYSEVNLTLSHEDDAASLLMSCLTNTGIPRVFGYRRGPNDPLTQPAPLRFRGPLAGIQEQSDEASLLTATFRSPFSVLIGDGDKSGRFLTSQFPTVYASTDAGFIAKALIDTANTDSLTGLATDPSLIESTTQRNATYAPGQNIGSAITNLSALLDGFDFFETPASAGETAIFPINGPTNLQFAGFATGTNWSGPFGTVHWVVTAITSAGETGASNEAAFPISNPVNHAVNLTWDAVPGATGYHVFRSMTAGGEQISPALVASVGAVTTYTDTGTPTTAGAASFGPAWYPDAFFNVAASQGQINPSARFEYGPKTLGNVQHMDRTTTTPLNALFVTGGNGLTSIYTDANSVAKYGKWWGHYDFPDVIDQTQLDAKARALCRPNPVKTVSIVPELGLDNCPKPFDDFNLGDTVPFYASRNALTENTQLRINGFVIPISDDGIETVSVTDPTMPGEDAVTMAQLTAEVDVTS